jgi:cell division septal protein FtsQ
MGLHHGFKSSLGKICILLFVAYFLFSLLCGATVISESTASLAISVSIVEGDTFLRRSETQNHRAGLM